MYHRKVVQCKVHQFKCNFLSVPRFEWAQFDVHLTAVRNSYKAAYAALLDRMSLFIKGHHSLMSKWECLPNRQWGSNNRAQGWPLSHIFEMLLKLKSKEQNRAKYKQSWTSNFVRSAAPFVLLKGYKAQNIYIHKIRVEKLCVWTYLSLCTVIIWV